jgi:CBS domain-containing protein
MAEKAEKTERQEKEPKGREMEASGRSAGEAMGRATRESAQAAEEGARSVEQMGRGAVETSGAVAQRGFQAAGEGARHLARETVEEFGKATRTLAETAERTMADLGHLMQFPNFAGEGVRQMQHAASGLVARVMQTNTRAVQELFRMANPTEVIAMQHRFVQQYIQGLIEASAEVLQVTRRLADDALEPIEEARRQAGNGQREGGQGGRIADVMTREVEVADPNQTVRDAARLMAESDTGALPVGENDRLVGMITDRDIAVRVTAEGRDPQQTRVRDVMTPDVRYVYEDEDIDHVVDNMAEQKVRRLPVVNRSKRLVGIVSLGDIATTEHNGHAAGRALRSVARPGGRHMTQAAHAGSKPARQR